MLLEKWWSGAVRRQGGTACLRQVGLALNVENLALHIEARHYASGKFPSVILHCTELLELMLRVYALALCIEQKV